MGIERGQHAVDRRLYQGVVADFVDIFGAYALEDLAEQIELLVGFSRVGRRCCAEVLAQREHEDSGGDRHHETRTLHPFTLCLGPNRHDALGIRYPAVRAMIKPSRRGEMVRFNPLPAVPQSMR